MTIQSRPNKPSLESYLADPKNPFKLDLDRMMDRGSAQPAPPRWVVQNGEVVPFANTKIGAAPFQRGAVSGSAVLTPTQAPGPRAVAVVTTAPGPAIAPSLEVQATQEWKASSDLKSSFPTVGAYVAFRQAVAAGRVRGYAANWQPSDGLIQKARSRSVR